MKVGDAYTKVLRRRAERFHQESIVAQDEAKAHWGTEAVAGWLTEAGRMMERYHEVMNCLDDYHEFKGWPLSERKR